MPPVLQQQTLRESVNFEGVGLHSGNRVSMSFLQAPPNSGIRFRRVDLDGRPEVEARVENVSDTTRSTTLSKGNIRIHTVEHVMATFAGYGIDNVIVELDGNEPPIADGSARAYCRMIETAGVAPQPEKREPYKLTTPLELHVGESVLSVFPHDRLRVTCTSADKHGRFTQFFSAEVSPETWERELAHARTFCFYEEIEFLIKNGLIRGGSLENAVVIRDDAVLTTEPLRYPEEFVRHKMLDIMQIMKILPHRYPFLMVDQVTKIDGTKITGVKNVSVNEPFFEGHFPGHPIMPGVLQLEAIAQVAGILTLRQAENMGKLAYFMAAENVKWRKPVRPGDTLVIDVELTKARGKVGKAKGVCSVNSEVVSEAEVTFMMAQG